MMFIPHSITLRGSFEVGAPVDEAFPLFSPEGERSWVPGWDPELLLPRHSWEQGMIFRTKEEFGDAIWIIAELDLSMHRVLYYRVEPGRYVARIEVICTATSPNATGVNTSYTFLALSDRGKQDILAMTQAAYDEKMKRWTGWIDRYLRSKTS